MYLSTFSLKNNYMPCSVHFSPSVMSNSVMTWTASCQSSMSITNSQSLLKFMSIKSGMPTKHLIICHPFSCLQTFPASRSFPVSHFLASGSQSIEVCFSISPSNEYSGLISFRIDWLDLLAVQGTLKSLLQHHSSKASVFSAQLSLWSNSHIHTWLLEKNVALTRWTFVDKVMSLLFNMLSRVVIAILPRSKRILISWLQSPSAVILEHQKINK